MGCFAGHREAPHSPTRTGSKILTDMKARGHVAHEGFNMHTRSLHFFDPASGGSIGHPLAVAERGVSGALVAPG